jgi:UDP-GlcNAc3NAcA epimerase
MKKTLAIIGARPQFIKHFAFERVARNKIDLITLHTGQHYDDNMSDVFFRQFGMQTPTYLLNHGGGNHGEQTGKMLIDIEKIILSEKPDAVIVYGDTNSTLAGALVASKLHIPLFHVEAGLRSYNKTMPEEINRILTDHVSSLLFATSDVAIKNLGNEGITENVILVGDIMKDLIRYVVENHKIGEKKYENYYYATIHRPYNTDNPERLSYIMSSLNSTGKKVVFSLHPRTKKILVDNKIDISKFSNLIIIDPQAYINNLSFLYHSNGLITDSGGMQKEAYWLKRKCITIRTETEWTETVELKGNILLFDELNDIGNQLEQLPSGWDESLYGDGRTAEKILNHIIYYFQ